ncbi:Ser/Thr protein phosphatase [Tritrichomonas foetus]|uniref:Serine/threonine-protein phosphatase n=1 Tax=Tritrichomonas foetus TaxID=1144522 RepID=A0A1J4JZM1_9EUKA|nr:Ser/Thr protein phosphatase [Tritrichomonas foetus]|eukprot:OHT04130.1 Ser/Thr protein phosphatase [Tritrichomonas foetus]
MQSQSASNDAFKTFLMKHLELLHQDVLLTSSLKIPIHIPVIPPKMLHQLCEQVSFIFSLEPSVLELTSPITIVGDLHGHYLDLIRIHQDCGHPCATKYLFLGDIVDRGEFSLETITLIYLMKVLYPTNVYIIRGNHEFDALCSKYGFYSEIYNEYRLADIYQNFLTSFSYMPIGAIIDDVNICVHGGIGPQMTSVEIMKSIRRPIDNFLNQFISPLVWSDPSAATKDFKASPRGTGYLFGQDPLLNFLEVSHSVRLIRGHECVQTGFISQFEDRCITVFSASNYCGVSGNESAVLILDPNGEDEIKTFPPLPLYKRNYAVFDRITNSDLQNYINISMSTGICPLDQHKKEQKHKANRKLMNCYSPLSSIAPHGRFSEVLIGLPRDSPLLLSHLAPKKLKKLKESKSVVFGNCMKKDLNV